MVQVKWVRKGRGVVKVGKGEVGLKYILLQLHLVVFGTALVTKNLDCTLTDMMNGHLADSSRIPEIPLSLATHKT